MKAILHNLADRLLSGLGLELDLSVDLRESFFTEITPTLYLGAKPNRERVDELKEAGITHVVSCLVEDDRSQVAFLREDFHHLFLGVHDGMNQDIASTFSEVVDFAGAATAGDSQAKLFVHCEVGVSRSATLVIALLMKTEGIGFFDALRRVRARRVQVLPNIGFASQLQRLESTRRTGVAIGSLGDVEDHARRGAADLVGEGAIVTADLNDERSQLLDDAECLTVHFELHGRISDEPGGSCWNRTGFRRRFSSSGGFRGRNRSSFSASSSSQEQFQYQ